MVLAFSRIVSNDKRKVSNELKWERRTHDYSKWVKIAKNDQNWHYDYENTNTSNWLKLTQIDLKWLKLTQIEFGWLKITSNDSKMPYRVKMLRVDGLTQIDSYWPKITTNDSKWLKMF